METHKSQVLKGVTGERASYFPWWSIQTGVPCSPLFVCEIKATSFAPDDKIKVIMEIKELLQNGIGLIIVDGGMSVDPDDITRVAIAEAWARDVVYGTPVLPCAMFLYGRFGLS